MFHFLVKRWQNRNVEEFLISFIFHKVDEINVTFFLWKFTFSLKIFTFFRWSWQNILFFRRNLYFFGQNVYFFNEIGYISAKIYGFSVKMRPLCEYELCESWWKWHKVAESREYWPKCGRIRYFSEGFHLTYVYKILLLTYTRSRVFYYWGLGNIRHDEIR